MVPSTALQARQQPCGPRRGHQLLETHGFGFGDIAAERRELVRPPPLLSVVFRRQLHDQLVVQEALDEPIERSRS